jgi:hypothetical protein
MTLHDDVMNDLLTVYLAGEASAATRSLVDARAAADPAFAARLAAAQRTAVPDLSLPGPAPNAEMTALKHTRQFLFLRTLFVAWGILFTLLPLLFTFDDAGVRFVLWGRYPALVTSFWSLAAASWVAAFVMHRQVRPSGL